MTSHPGKMWLLFAAIALLAGCSGGGGGRPPAPTITSFTAARSTVTAGTGTTLTAVFSGGTGSVSNGVGAISSGVPLSTGNLGTSTTFLLTVTNKAGTAVTRAVTVGVVGAPRIVSFTANPNILAPGEKATLTAVFENGAGSVDQGIGTITSGVGVGTMTISTTTTYRLTVTNAALDSVTADLTVTITRFRATGSLTVPRFHHTATLLQDGRVLVAGGDALGTAAEIYDPATGAFVTTGSMGIARRGGHAATLLADGRVLVSGGGNPKPNPEAGAELYDPATGSFTPTGAMLHGRTGHTATTLPDGKVLIVGGCCTISADSFYVDDEIYDPVTGAFSAASPRVPRSAVYDHAAIRLSNGEALIAYGYGVQNGVALNLASVFAPVSGLFRQVGAMQYGRRELSAALLNDGRVLVVGWMGVGSDYNHRQLSLYEPATETFTLTAESPLFDVRTATTLPDGTVLVTGNVDAQGANEGSAERYEPGTDTFKGEGLMHFPKRFGHTATPLLTGEVLFVGGTAVDGTVTSSAELFR